MVTLIQRYLDALGGHVGPERLRGHGEAHGQQHGPRAVGNLVRPPSRNRRRNRRSQVRVSGTAERAGHLVGVAPEQSTVPRSIVKRVTLVVITAVEGAPVSEICSSTFCIAMAVTASMAAVTARRRRVERQAGADTEDEAASRPCRRRNGIDDTVLPPAWSGHAGHDDT